MATTSELDRVAMVVLRYLRMPLIVLIVVYAIGITGMALIPGVDAEGNVAYMSLFHAFYFFTYTATTTGFGEIPNAFTDAQRLWTIFCLYMGVISWLYAIGSIIRLVQNPHFLSALNEHQFANSVKRIRLPFFIICGFGDTGSLLARGLSDHWLGAVVLDTDPERIKALALRDYRLMMPALCADPGVPKHLVDAGVCLPNCKAVVVLTNNEEINLRISIMARFLNPDLPILCRSTSERHSQHLETLGKVTVINPFEIFAQLLSMAITAPRLHNLNSCLVRTSNICLGEPLDVPTGEWILCGYGRMGKWLHKYFERHGIHPVIIDPDVEEVIGPSRIIKGHADHQTLEQAGIQQAAGIVAGTDSDHDNLSILMCVRSLRPSAFTIVRQNSHDNQVAFNAARADLILQSSLTTARRILKHLISPQIQILIDYLGEQGETITQQVVDRLNMAIGEKQPHLWRVNLCDDEAIATVEYLKKGGQLRLGELLRDPYNLEGKLSCIPLAIERGDNRIMLPADNEPILECDEILLCGTENSETMLAATLNNVYTLDYLITGIDAPRGYLFRWLTRKSAAAEQG
ncbi:MAG: potassium channel protein [Proteobacteria bacterium]|nr:potassium channel protein [Pseudomonadota bacterium]